MTVSKLRGIAPAGALLLIAMSAVAPARAEERGDVPDSGWIAAPLDAALLNTLTAPGFGDIAALAWFPRPGDIAGSAGVSADAGPGAAHRNGVVVVMQQGQGMMTLEERDGHGGFSRIVQSGIVDLSARGGQNAIGVILQSAAHDFSRTSQSATNVVFVAALQFPLVR